MINDDHLGDDKAQYENWDSRRVLEFLTVRSCRRLDMLRGIEEQRCIALPATSEQQKFLLQLVRELKDGAGTAEPDRCPKVSTDTEVASKGNATEAQDAFDKLDPVDRSTVRDACKTLLSINNVLAEGFSEHKQSARGREDQSQEHAQVNRGEGADS